MDDTTDIRQLIQQYARPDQPGLYTLIVRRLRACGTMFENRIKLILVFEEEEQKSALPLPYLLVIPTIERPRVTFPDLDQNEFINPRYIAFVGQFSAGASDLADGGAWQAADAIDAAGTQLMLALINWRPTLNFKPTIYAGMKLLGPRQPEVKVVWNFCFLEQFTAPEYCGCEEGASELDNIAVNIIDPCAEECPPPCPPPPCPTPPRIGDE